MGFLSFGRLLISEFAAMLRKVKRVHMSQQYNLVVIGTGPAGSTVAKQCRAAGWQVAIVDSQPFGGTCALRGCTPKKVLTHAAELYDWLQRMQGLGLSAEAVQIDWQALMRFKASLIDPIPDKRMQEYAEAGIDAFQGEARFVDATTVAVGEVRLTGRHLLVATGSRPATLGIPGEAYLSTSDDFLVLERLPKRIVFVGGGYISFEFAHIARRAGAEVCILHNEEQPLTQFDAGLVDGLVKASCELGIDLIVKAQVKEIEKHKGDLKAYAEVDGKTRSFAADLIVHGASRVANIDKLDLERAGIAHGKGGIAVNEYLQSPSNPAVYAAGDVADTPGAQLTTVANLHAAAVTANLLSGRCKTVDYTEIPSIVFTTPPLASVGLLEAGAKDQGLEFQVKSGSGEDWNSVKSLAACYSAYKLLIEQGSGRILGAHLLGPHAQEIINVFAVAIRHGLTVSDLQETTFGYPTGASNISEMLRL